LEAEALQQAEEQKTTAEGKVAARREQKARTGKKARGREPQVPNPDEAVPKPGTQAALLTGQPHHVARHPEVEQNVGARPQAVSADSAYWDRKQVGDARIQGIDLHVATGKETHGSRCAAAGEGPPAASAAPPQGCGSR
jgi:hypothetical protein